MALVGLISDTHGKLDGSVIELFEGVDYIIHAGDVGSAGILWELEYVAPVHAVLGNNDSPYMLGASVKSSIETRIGGVSVFVTHYPRVAHKVALEGLHGLVVYGHTHIPQEDVIGGCHLVNPGSPTRPRGDSSPGIALIRLEDGKVGSMRRLVI